MAEAIGLASSIVALVQLSASVYSVTSKFYREAKDANSRISALATQTRSLSGVLQSLSLLASAPLFDDAGVTGPDFRNTYIESCHATLHKIKRNLEKAQSDIESGSHKKLITRSLKWPFTVQETNELTTELGQHRDVLQLALSADTMSQLLQCLAETKNTARSIQQLNQKFDRKASIDTRAKLTAKREEIVQFFLKVNPQHQLEDCRSRRQPNTGRWLIERNETFRDWLNSPGSRIWLSGIPGAGKTILCGTVIEEILQTQTTSTAAAFFFCDYKSAQSQESVNVISALAVQLAKQGDPAFELLESYYEELHPENGLAKSPETKGMVKVIRAMIDEYDRVYLVIDGLDECGPNAVEVILALNELASGDQVNMALFSRNEPDIADELSDSLRIEIAAHTEDIELYVLAQMENRKRLKSLAVKNADLHEHILHTLIEGANGMFRWVACQLDHLDSLPTDGRRRKALTELPPTLFETYDRILDRMMQEDDHGREICRKALHWIGLGYKHISPEALCEAISIPDDEDVIDKELLVDTEWVSRSCSSLIRLADQEPGFPHFQLAHFTVKEYLRSIKPDSKRSIFRFSEDEAMRKLVQTSLRFLTFQNFDQLPTLASSEIRRMAYRNEQHPFYPFAASYIFSSGGDGQAYWPWGYMTDSLDNDSEFTKVLRDGTIMKYAVKLFDPDKTAIFLSWVLQAIWNWPQMDFDDADFSKIIGLLVAPEFSTLHVAASLALPSICTHLLETRRIDLNMSSRLGTPLHALLAGISIYRPDRSGNFEYDESRHFRWHPPNRTTAYNESRQCLEAFIRNSADTSARWGSVGIFQMAINCAIKGDKFWVEPLVTPSAAIDEACINNYKTSFTTFPTYGPFFDAIIALGSMPDISPMWIRLAFLIQASRAKHGAFDKTGSEIPIQMQRNLSDEDFVDAVRISLDQNLTNTLGTLVQDPRFRANTYIPYDERESEPTLHFAIRAGSPKLLELLFEAGCDPRVVDENDGWTGLHQCAWFNKDDAANTVLLLESGVIDSITNVDGKTCWHLAAEQGNIPFLEVLIKRGSDTAKSLRTTSKEGRTPLASSILNAETETALLLLKNCKEELEVFQSDQSLLEKAVAIGSEELFPLLHEKMKQAGTEDTVDGSKLLSNINMACSPKLLDYLLTTWATDNKSRSDALVNYLVDANNPEFEQPEHFPEHADLAHVITQLLPSVGGIEDQSLPLHFWTIFCQKVVINLTQSCNHEWGPCREGLINMIFDILIEAGVLESYEQNTNLPSYRILFQSLLDERENLSCSWIPSSIERVIEASTLSKDLANDATGNKLLSPAVSQSATDLVTQLLERGLGVHSSCGPLSPIEQACYSSDLSTFEVVIRHSDRSHINRVGNRGKTPLHWVVSGNDAGHFKLSKIRRLLKLGADIESKVDDPNADTALTLASRSTVASLSDTEDIVALLVSEGANPLHRGRDGWSLLHAAALTGAFRHLQSLDQSHIPESYWRGTCEYPLVSVKSDGSWHLTQSVTAAHLAAANGRTDFLRFMTQHNLPLDVNAVTGFPSVTPLNLASVSGHLSVVEFLLGVKANVNARNSFGVLPIELAAHGGHIEIVKALLKSGSETPSRNFGTPIAFLMSKDGDIAEETTDSAAMSRFSFEKAIINGDLDCCKRIVKTGQSINAELLTHPYTPLVRAVIEGQTAIVDWLVSSVVEVRNPVFSGLHPSMRCITSLATRHISSPRTLSAIMSLALAQSVSWYGTILGPLHVAILDNKVEALEVILKHIRENDHAYRRMIECEMICVPAEIINWRGRTALSTFVNSFNRDEAFAANETSIPPLPPGTPLHWAIRKSDLAAVRLLLKNEADVNQADSLRMTPLQLAVRSRHPTELVQELLQADAGRAEPSHSRIDTIRCAIGNGDLKLVKTLAEADPETLKGVDQNFADTLLRFAGSAAVFRYLVSSGSDPFKIHLGMSAVSKLLGSNSRSSGFAIESGLVIQSPEESLAFALATVAFFNNQGCIRLVKTLRRVLPSDRCTRIVNWSSRDNGSPLCLAASVDAAGMAKALIYMGAELDLEGCRYGSPLMAACAWGNLNAARVLVRAGALLSYVNEEGVLRSAIGAASRHQKVKDWLLVGRYTEQPKIDYQPSQTTPPESVWSGPRLFKLALPAYMYRDFGEPSWSHLRRLQKWKDELRGSTLAESRRDSGLDFYAESGVESRIEAAEVAHQSFLMKLGEV